MNQTSNQLLTNIFNVLSKIEKKVSSNTSTSSVVGGMTKGGANTFNQTAKPTSKTSTMIGSILLAPTITKLTKGFGANKDATAYLKFIDTLVKINEKASKVPDKTAVDNLLKGVFNDNTKLISNIKNFVKLEQSGILGIAVKGMENLINQLKTLSSSIKKSDFKSLSNMTEYIAKPMTEISKSLINFGKSILIFGGTFLVASSILGFGSTAGIFVATLGGISLTLLAFAGTMGVIGKMDKFTGRGMKVLNGISNGLIGFTASLVVMASSVLLLNAITGNPMTTAGAFIGGFLMVAGGIMVLAGAMALIGGVSTVTEGGIKSLKGMGMAILAISASLAVAGILMFGASYLSMGEHMSTPIVIGLSVLAMAGMFGIIGKYSVPIKSGATSVALMGGSILMFGATLALTALMFQKVFDTSKGWGENAIGAVGILAVVGGIVGMSMLYASVIAPAAPLVAAGALGVIVMAGSMLLMTYAMKKAVDVTANVPKGFGATLTEAIGGFIGGMWNGFKEGFGFKDGNLAVSALKGAAKVVALGTGSALLMTMSAAMIKFAEALSFFGASGNIQLYETDSNGNLIPGKTVDTVQASASIGIAISTFLSKVSEGAEKLDSKKTMKVAEILLGSSAASFLGLKIKPKPGLLDATIKFADMIDKFAGKPNTFRVYDPKTKKYNEVSIVEVSKSIGQSIMTFFTTISKGVEELGDAANYDKIENMAAVLMGKTGMYSLGWTGLKREPDKIGILEPVLKFAEIVKLLGSGKYLNAEGKEVEINMDGGAIAEKIIKFSSTLMDGLAKAEISDTNTNTEGFSKFTEFIDTLGSKTDIIDKVATSIDRLAESTSKLVTSLNELNVSKFEAIMSGKGGNTQQNSDTPTNNSNNYTPQAIYQSPQSDNSDLVANKVMSALTARTFMFEFTNNNGGKLSLR